MNREKQQEELHKLQAYRLQLAYIRPVITGGRGAFRLVGHTARVGNVTNGNIFSHKNHLGDLDVHYFLVCSTVGYARTSNWL
jgi:hypothetical protein